MLALLVTTLLTAQPVATDAPDSDAYLRQYAKTRRFMAGRPTGAKATPDGKTVLFLRSGPTDAVQALYTFDVASGQTRELLTAERLLGQAKQELTPEEKAAYERMRISARGFTSFTLSEDGKKVLLPLSGKLYVVELQSGGVTQLKAGPGAFDPRFSPDGKHVAYVRDNDVWAVELASNRERRITRGGTELKTHGLAEFVAQEEMSRFSGYWWSPDSRSIAFTEADSSALETFTIADPLHPEQGAHEMKYPRPGKANATVRLAVVPASGRGEPRWVTWDAKAFPYLATVVWAKGGPLTLLVQNREQTAEQLLAADVATGRARTLLTEKDDAWINLDQAFPRWRKDGKGFYWLTERNGAPEVELRGNDGALLSTWVKTDAGFADLVGVDEASDSLYFTGGTNPTESLLWRVRAGGAPERVATPDAGSASVGASLG
ncbi:MAG: DPP IV N-terminal domain-containing protein, partial [Myxococcaceae bacterium]|nr:DPP IV N-terminal domain-containing protein [Myxococcaceae bacterium]